MIGTSLGHYRIVEKIGAGGMDSFETAVVRELLDQFHHSFVAPRLLRFRRICSYRPSWVG
jgi:hypothetical protein